VNYFRSDQAEPDHDCSPPGHEHAPVLKPRADI
jgi:hypothetical protein